MAIRLIDQYPNRVGTPSADYPHGEPRNRSAPGAVDGTPFEQAWFRDQEGFFQGLLETAGITPSGSPDTVDQSDYFDALVSAMHGVTEVDVGGVGDVTLGIYPSRVAALRLTGTLGADVDLIVPDTERLYTIIDETTGDFSVTVRTGAGTGVELTNGIDVVRSDGSNVVVANPGPGPSEQVWLSKAIGETFGLRDDLAGVEIPPTDNPNFRYIKLTAGEDGAGQYNEGVLTGESILGSAPLVVATAAINYAASPINGETVNLWNTEGRYAKPGASSGAVKNDQMQQITGTMGWSFSYANQSNTTGEGALSPINKESVSGDITPGTGSDIGYDLQLDSANSPDARAGDHTDVKHQQLTYYMRIA